MGIVEETERKLRKYVAPNYRPLPFVPLFARGEWIYAQSDGFRPILDMHSTYSALNLGHNHPEIINLKMVRSWEGRPSKIARGVAELSELADFAERLCKLCGMEMMIPKNSGYEAFDVAVKTARKWGYDKKGISKDKAEIIVCGDSEHSNFHGRGGFAIDASTDPSVREGELPPETFTSGEEKSLLLST